MTVFAVLPVVAVISRMFVKESFMITVSALDMPKARSAFVTGIAQVYMQLLHPAAQCGCSSGVSHADVILRWQVSQLRT